MKVVMEKLRRRLAERIVDEEGAIVVEFIVMLPLLALWFVGSLTFFEAYRSYSLTAKVAYAISDIASKYGEGETPAEQGMYVTDLEELLQIQQRMLPRRVTRGALRVTSVCYWEDDDDPDDFKYRVLWSWADNGGFSTLNLTAHDDTTLPTSIMPTMANQDTVMFVEVYAEWEPIATLGGIMHPLTWVNRLTERPRILPGGIPLLPDYPNTVCNETGEIGVSG